jgi:hypothetical protein
MTKSFPVETIDARQGTCKEDRGPKLEGRDWEWAKSPPLGSPSGKQERKDLEKVKRKGERSDETSIGVSSPCAKGLEALFSKGFRLVPRFPAMPT